MSMLPTTRTAFLFMIDRSSSATSRRQKKLKFAPAPRQGLLHTTAPPSAEPRNTRMRFQRACDDCNYGSIAWGARCRGRRATPAGECNCFTVNLPQGVLLTFDLQEEG